MEIREKQAQLERGLRELGSVMVAYSGGIDSAYLAYVAHRVLGESMLAVIADSPSLARTQLADALAFAQEHAIPVQILHTAELEREDYAKNDASRCFYCKDELFTVMAVEQQRLGYRHLAYGMNLDDRGDFRPGQKAAKLHGAVAPLAEAEMTKEEIRMLAREAGLRIWDKPASACLSSRVEYGIAVTRDVLQRIEEGEELLRQLGYRQFRVRFHGELARIEIARAELSKALSLESLDQIVAGFKAIGFQYVTLDCEGYRSGSMNAVLPVEKIRSAQ
ncbi:MAG: ATP-dependent sacrificial sulfur transferase LarE [Acidobacteriaceae bacterium]